MKQVRRRRLTPFGVVLASFLVIVLSGCGASPPRLEADLLIGEWDSGSDATLILTERRTFTLDNFPADLWDYGDGKLSDRLTVTGTWQLCANEPNTSFRCEPSKNGEFSSVRLRWRGVSVNGGEPLRENGTMDNIEVTEESGVLVIWLNPHPDIPEDVRTRFVKS
ncbi:hypothetical protein LX16_4935 [Stackebrandtia albiflava]|uniref:Uncharacterized protein n=1 Tax=Stackebrandtia albiflava TaxID=406432 RepID=A0A562UQ70_9ACTN|nr:hypothetical protein [Stackebrandtia albiflava]TWJ07772.1 hypothetical protein LX16_4935 [Stackebrandtia albiflava]